MQNNSTSYAESTASTRQSNKQQPVMHRPCVTSISALPRTEELKCASNTKSETSKPNMTHKGKSASHHVLSMDLVHRYYTRPKH